MPRRPPLYTHPVPRTLIVTNDFPPRRGGIQSFVYALATRLPAGTVTVYAPAWKAARSSTRVSRSRSSGTQLRSCCRCPPPHAGPWPPPPNTAAIPSCSARRRRSASSRGPSQGRSDQGGRADPRARGGLGRAPRRPHHASPHRRRGGRGHVPRRVLPGAASPRAVGGGGEPDGPAGPGMDVTFFRPGAEVTRSGSG